MKTPFKQQPFVSLPEKPIYPHHFFTTEEKKIEVSTAHFKAHQISYRVYGSGKPLLLLHGLMTTGYSWRYVLPILGEHYQLIIPDLVGCGRSDKPLETSYNPKVLAQWVIAFQKAVGIYGCACIGNSMGGYIAMHAVLEDEKCFSKLINIHSPAIPLCRLYALQTVFKLPFVKQGLQKIVQLNTLKWAHRNVHYFDESYKSLEEAHEYGKPLATDAGVKAFIKFLEETVSPYDMKKFMSVLKKRNRKQQTFAVPLTLIYAKKDPMVPPIVGKKLASVLPDATMIWLDNASHFAHVDATERLCKHALDVLLLR